MSASTGWPIRFDVQEPDFKTLFESAPGLYLVLTPELRIVAVSNSYLQATMTTRDQIIGRGLFEVFPDNPDDPAASGVRNLKLSLERVLKNCVPDTMAIQKYDIRRPESEGGGFEERFWSPVNYPAIGKNGEITYIIHRVEDVTEFIQLKQKSAKEQKASDELRAHTSQIETELFLRARELDTANQKLRTANEELERLYEKAKEVDRLKSQFFANVSHELRTPLTLLLGPIEELLKIPDTSVPVSRPDLELMQRNSLRLLRLVNMVLDLSGIEAGRVRGEYAPMDLAALTADCASLFRSVVERGGLQFHVELERLDEPVCVDRAMWEKIVLNLLSNAFKFTLQGSITVTLKRAGNAVQLRVADTGVGISESELPHIFERFHRAREARGRTFEGTGIGLALVQELVKLHGGSIEVQSRLNQGSVFTVTIPFGTAHLPATEVLAGQSGVTPTARAAFVAEAEMWDMEGVSAATPQNPAAGPEAGDGPAVHRPRIVFADDNADMRTYITRLLGRSYEVEAVSNGEQALAAALRKCPDLVLTDVMMPVMDGFQLLQALRTNPLTETIPVVLVSARAEEYSRIESLESGADDYLVKPFTARELLARVRSHIKLTKLREEAAVTVSRSERRFRQVLETAPDPILEVDGDGRILLLNGAAETVFGYTRDEFLQLNVEQLVPAAVRGQHARHRADYGEKPRMRRMGIGLELKAQKKDGSLFPVEIGLSPNWSEGGLKIIVVIHDVSERKRAEEAIKRSEEKLRQAEKLEALARLAGGTAHEFNNLLTMVMGYAALMLSSLESKETLIDYVEKISRASKRAAELTRQLLAFSKRQVLAPQVLDLNAILAEAIEVLPSLIGTKIQTHFSCAPEPACVRADRSQLHQVIINLVTNARDAMPEGGTLSISITNTWLDPEDVRHPGVAGGKYVELAVADTGTGIAREVQSRLFEPFFSTKAFGAGAGLSLAAIYGIVQQSGGNISVESTPGTGTTFRIFLPRVAPEEAAPSPLRPVLTNMSGTETILLVEDQAPLRDLTKEFLQKLGYQVLEAEHGEDAIRLAAEFPGPIHLLLTDVIMPGMNGPEMVSQIKPGRSGMKVLYVSGYTHDAFTGDQTGGPDEAFLEKPFAFEELAQKIREVLDADSSAEHGSRTIH